MANGTENDDWNLLTCNNYNRANTETKYSLLGVPRLKPIGAQKDDDIFIKWAKFIIDKILIGNNKCATCVIKKLV